MSKAQFKCFFKLKKRILKLNTSNKLKPRLSKLVTLISLLITEKFVLCSNSTYFYPFSTRSRSLRSRYPGTKLANAPKIQLRDSIANHVCHFIIYLRKLRNKFGFKTCVPFSIRETATNDLEKISEEKNRKLSVTELHFGRERRATNP